MGPEDYLVSVAENDPRTFCSLLGRVLPSEIRADLATPDNDVLAERILEARKRARLYENDPEPGEPEQVN